MEHAVSWRTLATLRREREGLVERRRQLVAARRQLFQELPPRWRMGRDRVRWTHGLDPVEFRDETALVDQLAQLEHYVTPEGEVASESLQVETRPNRDARWWSAVMAGEAALARRFIDPQERFFRRVVERQESLLDRTRIGLARRRAEKPVTGWPASVVLFLPLLIFKVIVKSQAVLLLGAVQGQKAITKSSVNLPLNLHSGFAATREELKTGESRRKFRLAFLNERLWTPERRSAVLFVIALTAGLLYLFSEIIVELVAPAFLPAKRMGDVVLLYAAATRLFLPTPFEPILTKGAAVLSVPGAAAYAAVGATIGSYVLFLLGSQMNQGLHAFSKAHPRLGRMLAWMEDRGRKYAYWILGFALAIPLMPDSLAILGTLIRLRLSGFLMVIFLSTTVRSLIFLLLIARVG